MMVTDRLLLKPKEAAFLLNVSVRTMYDLMKINQDVRAAVVEIAGLRGRFIRADLLKKAIERLSPAEAA